MHQGLGGYVILSGLNSTRHPHPRCSRIAPFSPSAMPRRCGLLGLKFCEALKNYDKAN